MDQDFDAEGVREQLQSLDLKVRSVVQRSPLVAVAGALVLGFVVGRIVSR
jgi:hypothetical protein